MKAIQLSFVLVCVALLGSCESTAKNGPKKPPRTDPTTVPGNTDKEETAEVKRAREDLRRFADAARSKARNMTFEQFKATVYREPDGGKFIVNGDTPIANEKLLEEFFENEIQGTGARLLEGGQKHFARPIEDGLVVHAPGGRPAVWSSAQQRSLTYCVSSTFGSRHARVVAAMEEAAGAWEAAADIDFIHVDTEDGECNEGNDNVLFDVRPVSHGSYLARAFFPDDERPDRNVLIDESSFTTSGNLMLEGVLRHELGHTLGFRHEHTRPESGTCFEDEDWVPLTDYDPFSVMHYPQCNGQGDWSLTLTHKDRNGAACLYGPAPEFEIDPEICDDPREPPEICRNELYVFSNQSVAERDSKIFGPYPVSPGDLVEATMTGTGDPDLYVRFGDRPPTTQGFDCRPYTAGADEACSLNAPADTSQVFVMVRGYRVATYELTIVLTTP